MEARANIWATNALHVPGLGMNLFSVSQLQDKEYDVYLIGKKAYVKHPRWKKKRQIGDRSNRLYRLQLESPMTLIGNSHNGEKELNELWHKKMGQLHMEHWGCSETLLQEFQSLVLSKMIYVEDAY